MLNKFSRSIKKYPIFSACLILALAGFILSYLNVKTMGNVLFIAVALLGFVHGSNRTIDTLRHGYYGITILPLTAIVVALFLKLPEVAALLSIVLVIEQPFTGKSKGGHYKAKHAVLVKLLDTATLPFSVLVLLIGGAVWITSKDATQFLSVVAGASTAPLLLAAPLTITRGFKRLKADLISMNSVRVYEQLVEGGTIVFKKSGVLTERQLKVSAVHAFGTHTKSEVLQAAASLAYASIHPITQAILDHTEAKHKTDRAKHAIEVAGSGIYGRKKGVELSVGKLPFLIERGVKPPKKPVETNDVVTYVAVDDVCIGAISFKETHYKLKGLANKLKSIGYRELIVASGGNQSSAKTVAKAAGIPAVYGDVDAAKMIQLLQEKTSKPVIFVGNDSEDEALIPQANIGISTDPQALQAPVQISQYNLSKLLYLLTSARSTFRAALRLSILSLLLSLFCILLAAAGALTPLYAALTNLAVTLLVLIITTGLKAKPSQQ